MSVSGFKWARRLTLDLTWSLKVTTEAVERVRLWAITWWVLERNMNYLSRKLLHVPEKYYVWLSASFHNTCDVHFRSIPFIAIYLTLLYCVKENIYCNLFLFRKGLIFLLNVSPRVRWNRTYLLAKSIPLTFRKINSIELVLWRNIWIHVNIVQIYVHMTLRFLS